MCSWQSLWVNRCSCSCLGSGRIYDHWSSPRGAYLSLEHIMPLAYFPIKMFFSVRAHRKVIRRPRFSWPWLAAPMNSTGPVSHVCSPGLSHLAASELLQGRVFLPSWDAAAEGDAFLSTLASASNKRQTNCGEPLAELLSDCPLVHRHSGSSPWQADMSW